VLWSGGLLACAELGERSKQREELARRAAGRAETERFLAANLDRYRQAVARATAYLDSFTIDPVELRRRGIKGKKKLVELLDAYVSLHRYAKGARRASLWSRFERAVEVTYRPAYHDLGSAPDLQFKQDITSYLRACYLMEKMRLGTRLYRSEIARIKPRLDKHLPRRGPHQRMVFGVYYRHLGYPLPAALRDPFLDTVTARRVPPDQLTLDQVYDLTHEVFVPYDYGANLAPRYFTDEDRRYLRTALDAMARRHAGDRNVDILGEILACQRYLGDTDLPSYRNGLEVLLAGQRPNGSFGDYERRRPWRGALLELDLYLHTTSVAMDILPLAFEGPRPADVNQRKLSLVRE
jgi:hypothetical protein